MEKMKHLPGEWVFENFIVGTSNKFAHAAAVAVANGCNTHSYNPLIIYGASGLGKSHLLHAIYNSVVTGNPQLNVIITNASAYVNDLVEAIKKDDFENFHKKYSSADFLLIDDTHILSRKQATQREFFMTLDSLINADKQVVCTCTFSEDDHYGEICV